MLAINQILNFCWKISVISSSNFMKTFRREIKPLVSAYRDTSGRIMTSRCNDAVGNINSTEKRHRMTLRFSKKFLQCVGKWLLADTIPNFIVQ